MYAIHLSVIGNHVYVYASVCVCVCVCVCVSVGAYFDVCVCLHVCVPRTPFKREVILVSPQDKVCVVRGVWRRRLIIVGPHGADGHEAYQRGPAGDRSRRQRGAQWLIHSNAPRSLSRPPSHSLIQSHSEQQRP